MNIRRFLCVALAAAGTIICMSMTSAFAKAPAAKGIGIRDIVAIKADANGKQRTVQLGKRVNVLLEETTKTCHMWSLKKQTGNSVKLRNEEHVDGDKMRPDGTFLSVYDGSFDVVAAGRTNLEFACSNEKGVQTATFTVTINVPRAARSK